MEWGALYGRRRCGLGIFIASLSGGWQLRRLLETRHLEFVEWFDMRLALDKRLHAMDAVTLEPRSIFGVSVQPVLNCASGFGLVSADALTLPLVLMSLLIGTEKIPIVTAEKWVAVNADIVRRMSYKSIETRTTVPTLAAIRDDDVPQALSLVVSWFLLLK